MDSNKALKFVSTYYFVDYICKSHNNLQGRQGTSPCLDFGFQYALKRKNFLSNQAFCTVQWNNAQIPDCVWPLAACFVKQWEAWPWWQPQDNSRPPWPLVSTRESHFMLFKTASETRVSFRVQSRFEFQVWHLNLISTLWKWSYMDFNVLGSHQTIIANCLFSK